MKILKRENWWIWLLLMLFSSGSDTFVLGALLDTYRSNAWYRKWYYWVLGLVFILPFIAMISAFYVEILCKSASKLNVAGKELYLSPYTWILCIIIPILGWIFAFIMLIYIKIDMLYRLYLGDAEKYIN
ncbi:MAG: hypothetical protein NC181_01335 [Clostridium sp.]|nr:hypothetical protein [Clostridium sp.]MCM1443979.1 hypothetical protein [Candidatus Amulumruptor caecigallinarius]